MSQQEHVAAHELLDFYVFYMESGGHFAPHFIKDQMFSQDAECDELSLANGQKKNVI